MQMMAIPFPDIDPVAIHLGPLAIRWYGLAYVAGLLLGLFYMRRLLANHALWAGKPPLQPSQADDFLIWAIIGVVVGGRLGFVLFYEPSMFVSNPLMIFGIHHGGMAFHGGLLGIGVAIYVFARLNRVPALTLMDLSAAAAPFGLFLGRIANFINGEIYGRLTDAPWAVTFPTRVLLDVDKPFPGPRHPTQLYEAFLEGVVMFALLRYFTHRRHSLARPGLTVGVFLIAYGCFRSFVEYFKEWDTQQFFTTPYFSEGVVYSLPMIALGAYFCLKACKNSAYAAVKP